MSDINQELSNLSKSIASATVSSVFKKHNIEGSKPKLSDDQKKELLGIAQNLEHLVNNYTSGEKVEEEEVKKSVPQESPLRMLLRKKRMKESEK